jgi:hypothetical protein
MQVQIEVKKVYGVDKIYPINDAAKALARIAGTKTLSVSDLQNASTLGLEVVEVYSNYNAIADLVDKKFAAPVRYAA